MRTRSLLVAALVALAAACSGEDLPGLEGPDDIDDSAPVDGTDSLKADSLNTTATYYQVVPDLRRCAWPTCGGWFVNRVNREWTHCNDGKWRNACYVVDMDAAALQLSDDELAAVYDAARGKQIVMRGSLVSRTYAGKRLGQFRPTEAWKAESASEPTGEIYKVTDRQLVCIYAPCPSLHEAKLNSTLNQDIHSLNLERLGSETLIDQAWSAMEDGPILVAGTHSKFIAPLSNQPGTSLDASQAWTRVRHQELQAYAPAASELTGGAFSDPTNAKPPYPRTYRFEDSGWNVVVEDLVAPCQPGVMCIWSGIATRTATWSLSGDRIRLSYNGAATPQNDAKYYGELQVKKDGAGTIVLVEVQDDGQATDRRFRADAAAAAGE